MTDAWWQNDPVVAANPAVSGGGDWWKKDPVVGGAPQQKSVPPQQSTNLLSEAAKPITSLPGTYRDMVHEATGEMGSGIGEAGKGIDELRSHSIGEGLKDIALGAGKAALGAASYISAPINAPIHTILGKPLGNAVGAATGSPEAGKIAGDTAELAASMLMPVPKFLPHAGETVEHIVPTTEELHAAADAAYHHPSIEKLVVKPSALQSWKDNVGLSLNKEGFNDVVAPQTFGILDKLAKAPSGSFVTGQNLNTLRKSLRKVSGSNSTDQAAASHAINSLDTFLEAIPSDKVLRGNPGEVAKVLSDARGNYAAYKRSQALDTAVENAELQAGSAHSGQNIDNATRQKIKSILTSPSKRRGYSPDELAQMKKAVVGTFTGDAARYFANLFGKGGGLGALHAGVTGAIGGGLAFGPVGAAGGAFAPALGFAFSKLSNAMTDREVGKLMDMVRSRSPLGEQMKAPIQKWSESAARVKLSPTSRNITSLVLSSRNLANNLKDAGITVEPDQLISASQTQVPGAPSNSNKR